MPPLLSLVLLLKSCVNSANNMCLSLYSMGDHDGAAGTLENRDEMCFARELGHIKLSVRESPEPGTVVQTAGAQTGWHELGWIATLLQPHVLWSLIIHIIGKKPLELLTYQSSFAIQIANKTVEITSYLVPSTSTMLTTKRQGPMSSNTCLSLAPHGSPSLAHARPARGLNEWMNQLMHNQTASSKCVWVHSKA